MTIKRRCALVAIPALVVLGLFAFNAAYKNQQRARSDALFLAIAARDVSEVERLLASGANANATQSHRRDAYHGIGKRILSFVNPSRDENVITETPLGNALQLHEDNLKGENDKIKTAIIRHLLAHGANPNIRVKSLGPDASTLELAIWIQNKTAINLLLDAGAKINPESGSDVFGMPPLFAAIEEQRADIVSLLLVRGADPNRKYWGDNALHHLLGADELDRTFLQDAVVVRLLLAHGASPTTPNYNGKSPLAIAKVEIAHPLKPAQKCAYRQAIDLLRQAGATR